MPYKTIVIFLPVGLMLAAALACNMPPEIVPPAGYEVFPQEAFAADHEAVTHIPAGEFLMGCQPSGGLPCEPDELPLHSVYLDGYAIDTYEVTNARYKACVDAGICTEPSTMEINGRGLYYGSADYAGFPVVGVTWRQAEAYCQWEGKRLPTEAEWEKAARGSDDARPYPWGDEEPADCERSQAGQYEADSRGYCTNGSGPVASFPRADSPYGVMNMAGNVQEWVNDWYAADYYSVSPVRAPRGPEIGEMRSLRGGAYWNWPLAPHQLLNQFIWEHGSSLRVSWRGANSENTASERIGFRCARSQDEPQTGISEAGAGDFDAEIFIPAGRFTMGSSERDIDIAVARCREHSADCARASFADQEPSHIVLLDAYTIDKYEVTNSRYQACVDAGVCTAPQRSDSATRSAYYGDPEYAAYPVIYVDWHQATSFCLWEGKRLPTEAEWERAALGDDSRLFPWGNQAPDCRLANFHAGDGGGCVGDTAAVGGYLAGASPDGLLDLAGNVWEWTYDRYAADYYAVSPDSNPLGPTQGTLRSVRGGSWTNSGDGLLSANRNAADESEAKRSIGFRCARSR